MSEATWRDIATDGAVRTMQATQQLRWFHHNNHDHSPRLQQAWMEIETGKIEWCDVSHFYQLPPPPKETP
jgi:hypothetical protein